MKDLRIALVVSDKRLGQPAKEAWKEALRKACHSGEVDLVVHSEGIWEARMDTAVETVRKKAEELRVPVLGGVWTCEDEFQTATYVNPNPSAGDTPSHVFVKHSSAPRLAYDMKGYKGRRDPMFDPIVLGGQKLGVMVCHDMFYGLITDVYMERGATGLIDLTGGDVRLSKWRNIVQARSIELGGPFLCTMSRGKKPRAQAAAIAFRDGTEVRPLKAHLGPDGTGGFAIFPVSPGPGGNKRVPMQEQTSSQSYKEIRVSLGGRGPADISVTVKAGKAAVTGTAPMGPLQGWHGFKIKAGRTGVLCLPLEDIRSPRRLHEIMPPDGAFTHHIVVYVSDKTPTDPGRIQALARLRAIEHRVAVGILAGDMVEMLKTNTYKLIQRFAPEGDVFGLDKRNLGGTRVACASGFGREQAHLIHSYLHLV